MDLPITLNDNRSLPLHQQLYEALRHAILTGRLLPQQRIPSTRALAKSLGISRATVAQSYEQLLSEGYLETIVGSGTYVGTQLPEELLHSPAVEADRLNSPATASLTPPTVPLSNYGRRLLTANAPEATESTLPISFRYGRPAGDLFPMPLWRKLLSRHCRDWDWLDYAAEPMGYLPLRAAIAHHLSRYRAVRCQPQQILITNGTQQALDLIARLLVDTGEIIALEDPGYLRARSTFLSAGATLLPVPVDQSGLVVSTLAKTVAPGDRVRLVYVTPSHQFPTGAVLSLSRRWELLAWAQQSGALIIEDDYDSEFRYGKRPIPALQGLDPGNSVLYVGTFSKVLFPSLRVGYLVLPAELVPVFARAKGLADRHQPLLEQRVLTDFITEGHLERHIRRMRLHYDQYRQLLVQMLDHYLGEKITILDQKAGIHLIARLHTDVSDDDIIDRAARAGVGMVSTRSYYLRGSCKGEFIFGYSELTKQQMEIAVQTLSKILQSSSI